LRPVVSTTAHFFNGRRYAPGEHVVMPNHVHALVKPVEDYSLERIVHSWKSFSANQINKKFGWSGRVWHSESFDYIVRSAAQLERFKKYIRDNPNPKGPSNGVSSIGR
jgi:REP element-mobilizing transposase RayT